MTSRRGRTWVRWTLLGATAGGAAVFGVALHRGVGSVGTGGFWGDLGGGFIACGNDSGGTAFGSGDQLEQHGAMPWLLPGAMTETAGEWVAWTPLWPLLFAIAGATCWVWLPVGRRYGWCAACGYDRSGLAAEARCPECGDLPAKA